MTTIGKIVEWLKQAIEYLAGQRDDAPPGLPLPLGAWWFWAVWWTAMAVLIYTYSGQATRFIYINF